MLDIPECKQRRNHILDKLINDLSDYITQQMPEVENIYLPENDANIKLICELQKILNEDPDMDLPQAIRKHLGLSPYASQVIPPQTLDVYACKKCGKKSEIVSCPAKSQGPPKESPKNAELTSLNKCCKGVAGKTSSDTSTQPQAIPVVRSCCSSKSRTPTNSGASSPVSKELNNLKKAVSFDNNCKKKVSELVTIERQLQNQILTLEQREKEGVAMLKQADCMWSCMEDAYKKKIEESVETQNTLLNQLKEIENSNNKWRRNKKDLEFQLTNVNKCQLEIIDKKNEKSNEVSCIKMEMVTLKKIIDSNKKETEAVKKSFSSKKSASEAKIAKIAQDIKEIKYKIDVEKNLKKEKEKEGANYLKEARNDFQEICKVLLKKKLENENLRAEKEALLNEIELLKQTCDQCKDKCQNRQGAIADEINKMDAEIKGFQMQCDKCHKYTDTGDSRKLCVDCPRCTEERRCLIEDGHCNIDPTMDCVCINVKQRFLDNVFENMYTVLERQAKTRSGKTIADSVLKCLKNSKNGKLDSGTRKMLQEFVLSTVKKNLNLTIIGGAVKTRCEMDADTYKQLMLCLKQVQIEKTPKLDKGTGVKKEPCTRWGGTSECNCPKGPKDCVCTKKAPPRSKDPDAYPPQPVDSEDTHVTMCPHKESIPCGVDCAMNALPSALAAEISSWKPAPCDEQQCQFSKNMRTAHCVLGPESLSVSKARFSTAPIIPQISSMEKQIITCTCGPSPNKSCICQQDKHNLKTHVEKRDLSSCLVRKQAHHFIKSEDSKQPEVTLYTDSNTKIYRPLQKDSLEIKRNSIIKHTNEAMQMKEKKKQKNNNTLKDEEHKNLKKETMQSFVKRHRENNKNVTFKKNIENINIKKCLCDEYTSTSLVNNYAQNSIKICPRVNESKPGDLVIEVDENCYTKIEQKIKEDPHLLRSVIKSGAKQFEIDLSPIDIVSNRLSLQNLLTNKLEQTASDLKVNRYLIKAITKTFPEKELTHINSESLLREVSNKLDIEISEKYQDLIVPTCDNLKEANTITLNINDNKTTKLCSAMQTMSSGTNVIAMDRIPSLIDVLDKQNEYLVTLNKYKSKSYLLQITGSEPNALLKKSNSGRLLVVEMLSDKNSDQNTQVNNPPLGPKIYKMHVKDTDQKIACPPAVLKETSSHNFIIVIDKEFESRYKQTITDYFAPNDKYPVNLSKTLSDSYLLAFTESVENINAVLVKGSLSDIKILTNQSDFETLFSVSNNRLKKAKSFPNFFKEMLIGLPVRPEKKLQIIKPSKFLSEKSNSDSIFLDKVQNHHNIQIESLTLLNQSSSGHHGVVLEEESKEVLINKLKAYLVSNPKGLILIKKSDSGKVKINVNHDHDAKEQYGSISITQSGNIYVILDENLTTSGIKNMPNDVLSRRLHMEYNDDMGEIQHPLHKSISTNCNALRDPSFCDSSKCICAEVLRHGLDKSGRPNFCKYCETDINDREKLKCYTNYSSTSICSNNCHLRSFDKNTSKLPHIVIKPCNCRLDTPRKRKSDECLFYYVTNIESTCPFHKDRYDNVSNELLEISGYCNRMVKNKRDPIKKVVTEKTKCIGEKISKENISNLDYLKSMPPQLPYFLRNV